MSTNIFLLKKKSDIDIDKLIDAENNAINEAKSEGYQDPNKDDDHKKMLCVLVGDKTYRRFITRFLWVTQDDISEKQIRTTVSDEKYCKEELAPLIDKEGLQHPIFVGVGTGSVRPTEHGHHRAFSVFHVLGKDSCPAFEVGLELYEMFPDGTYGPPVSNNYAEVLGRIQCNPPKTTIHYKASDVYIQLAELRKADKTFNDVIPSGEFPNREQFDDIMDIVHPRQFLYKGTRTKILNQWIRRGSDANSKIKSVTFADKTNDLIKHGYDSGVIVGRGGKFKRKTFLEHLDEKNKAYIGFTSTNGFNFQANIVTTLIKNHHDKTLEGDSSYEVVLYCEIYNPKETMTSLKQERNKFVEEVRKWNDILKNTCGLKFAFTKIIFPKQLTIASDNGKLAVL